MNIFSKIFQGGLTVWALVGASGTGKSFRAKLVCEKHKIDAIIDDGLLIQNDRILAGKTAKHEQTYMGAVRVALFDDKEHRDSVAKAIHKSKLKSILIIGTSEKMISKITARLQIPQPNPDKIIKIEDISSRDDIDKAIRSRQVEGKHVIPVPAIEIKKSYPQIFMTSIQEWVTRGPLKFLRGKKAMAEKSIVTPEFSKKGRLEISSAAITQMVMHCVSEKAPDVKVKKLSIKTDSHGYRLVLTVDVPLRKDLATITHELQSYIIDSLERFTGIMIEEVSIIIDKINMEAPSTQEEKAEILKQNKKRR